MIGQSAETSASGADLTEYLATVRRRWLWIALAALLTGLVGALFVTQQADQTVRYLATTTVSPAIDGALTQTNLEAEAELVRSDRIAMRVVDTIGLGDTETTASILDAVRVTVPADTGLIEIEFSAATPETATLGSRTVAESFLVTRLAQVESEYQARIDRLSLEIGDITAELSEATSLAVTSGEDSEERENALAVSSVLQSQLSRLRTERSLAIVEDRPSGEIVRSAEAIEKRSRQLPVAPLIAAAIGIGLLFGVILAFFIDRLDPRISSEIDAERTAGVASLASVPYTRATSPPRTVADEFKQAATAISSIASSGTNSVVIAPLLSKTRPSASLSNLVSGHLAAGRAATFLTIDSMLNPVDKLKSNDLRVVSAMARDADPVALMNELMPAGGGAPFVIASSTAFLTRPSAIEAAEQAKFLVLLVREGATRRDDVRTAMELAANTNIENVRVVVEARPGLFARLRPAPRAK